MGVPAKVLGDDDTQVLHHLGGIEILHDHEDGMCQAGKRTASVRFLASAV